jgi:hypothetical protein
MGGKTLLKISNCFRKQLHVQHLTDMSEYRAGRTKLAVSNTTLH